MKRALIAAALLAVASGSALAHSDKDAYLFNATVVGEQVGVEGLVLLFGCSFVSGTAGAVVNNSQHAWADISLYAPYTYFDERQSGVLTATTGSGAGSGISGNVGINISQGVDNAQSNSASLASVDTGNVFGNAQIFSSQKSGGTADIESYVLNASIGDNALQHVSGNVGVNVSSGAANVQNNSLAAATTQLNPGNAVSVAMAATDESSQAASLDFYGTITGTAKLGAGALAGSTGNIGMNIAGGVGNVQHNGLAIAAAGTH
ncbi:MAG TPA: hypothetical protein VNZ04_09470 [Trinickia sp.]|jgi:hypothetical protein|nr:hypothetical protein [Trinickia sp.]